MNSGQKILVASLFLFFGLALFAQSNRGVSGTSALPQELLRPQYGEDARFPKDYVIGELGRGDATEETYLLARKIVASLADGDGNVDQVVFPEQKRLAALTRLNALGVRSWRVGGGRSEGAGAYSFIVRFLGRERSITGELYLQWEEPIVVNEVEMEPVESALTLDEGTENPAEENTAVKNAETDPDVADPENADPENAELANAEIDAEDADAENVTAEAAEPAEIIGDIDAIETVVKPPAIEDQPHWLVDDLLLEPPRSLSDGRYGPGGADMTPYERFF